MRISTLNQSPVLGAGSLFLWPYIESIITNMTAKYKQGYPRTLLSQYYSEYKSNPTMKSLVILDPRGSFMLVSPLFSRSISDKDNIQMLTN